MSALRDIKIDHRSPLVFLLAGCLIVALAFAIGILMMLGRAKHEQVHSAAAERLITEGSELARFLVDMPLWAQTNGVALAWLSLPFLVEGLNRAQSGVQYIEVARDGVTLFHRQAGDPTPEGALLAVDEADKPQPVNGYSPVTITRELLDLFGESVPVIVFKKSARHADGSLIQVEIGMRQESVVVREQYSTQAVRWVLRLAVLILVLAGVFLALVIVVAVRRDRRLEKKQRQEEHLVFSGMVANSIVHDFRNPMSAVRLDAQMLEREARRAEGARPERLAELAGRIARTLDRMDGVFKEFLFLSRPAKANHERFDLVRCVRECVETLTARLEQAHLRVEMDLPAAPTVVEASEPALRRAIINILQNAVQHAPPDSVIDIHLTGVDDARVWTLDVADRGPGIPVSLRESVFEMFVTTRPEGTGLGLFMARTALRNFGGAIAALGRPGGGTVIRITLPKPRAAPARPEKGNEACPPSC
jgi:signal transduction histidine kinase